MVQLGTTIEIEGYNGCRLKRLEIVIIKMYMDHRLTKG